MRFVNANHALLWFVNRNGLDIDTTLAFNADDCGSNPKIIDGEFYGNKLNIYGGNFEDRCITSVDLENILNKLGVQKTNILLIYAADDVSAVMTYINKETKKETSVYHTKKIIEQYLVEFSTMLKKCEYLIDEYNGVND